MNFKEQMAADVRTFMNPREFANVHVLDERALWMIVENYTRDGEPFPYAEGVSVYRKVIHVDLVELGYVPPRGQVSTLDGLTYMVTGVDIEETDMDANGDPLAGIIKITLEANVG